MANTFTPTYNLTKPEIGSDTNAWGAHLNADLDTIDANMVSRILTSAQTLAGAINLPSNGLNVGSGQLRVTGGNVTASGGLTVSGATLLSTTLTVSSNVTFQGAFTLSGTGATSLGGALSVTGATTLAYNGLNVGAGQLNCTGGNVSMSGNLTVTGTCTTGNKTVNGTMNVTGLTTLASNGLNVGSGQLQVTGGNVTATGSITSVGLSAGAGTLYAGGATTLAGSLSVSGATNLASNGLNVGSGQLYVSSGNVYVANALSVGGTANLGAVSTGTVGCTGITCTTINTQGNTITSGSISSGAINTNGNALTSGSVSTGNIASSGYITATNYISIANTSPTMYMNDTDYGQFSINCDGGSIGFKGVAGGWLSRTDNNGDFFATSNVTAYSDAKLKENVETIREPMSLVRRMRGVFYDRIDSGAHGVGVIAQEMREVLPQVVCESDGTLSVAYGNIVGVLIEALKDIDARLADVEAR